MFHILFLQYYASFFCFLFDTNISIILVHNSKSTIMTITNCIKLFFIKYLTKKEVRNKYLFEHHFFVNRYYLNHTANEMNMSYILNMTCTELNQTISHYYDQDFKALCDMYRFKHFWEEFTNPLNAGLSVQSIIASCGFNSTEDFNSLIADHKEESRDILKRNFS